MQSKCILLGSRPVHQGRGPISVSLLQVLNSDEEAATLKEEDRPQIDLLDGLPQLVEAVARTPVSYKNSKRKKSLKLVKFVNLYE